MDYINFDSKKLKEFKKAYQKAINEHKMTFTFEGKEVLVAYAKYMIEYLESQLKGK